MLDSVFTKIYKGELPAYKVYEDDVCFAILDINPVARGHMLLITNELYEHLEDLPDDVRNHVFKVAQRLRPLIKEALRADYVIMSVVGEEVPHFHIQFIPRRNNDGLTSWQTHQLTEAEGVELESLLKEKLKS